LFIVLHYADIERFVWPYDLASWASILFNVVFGTLVPTYLWTLAFQLTSPLVVAVGVSSAVPLTLIFELAYSHNLPWSSVFAGSLVVAGFLLINTKSLCPDRDPEANCCTAS
jgi:drug/metabolite transporter (DMT)-like permease